MKYFSIILLFGFLILFGSCTKNNTNNALQILPNTIEKETLIEQSYNQKIKSDLASEPIQDFSNSVLTDNIELNEQIKDLGYLRLDNNMVEIPFFEIELWLTERAERKLRDDNESIIVHAYFEGYFDDYEKIPEKYEDKLSMKTNRLSLLNHGIELTDTRLARFEHLEFPEDLYNLLDDVYVLINIVSGRKSSEYNLLSCGILYGPISKIKEKRFTINGGLTSERINPDNITIK